MKKLISFIVVFAMLFLAFGCASLAPKATVARKAATGVFEITKAVFVDLDNNIIQNPVFESGTEIFIYFEYENNVVIGGRENLFGKAALYDNAGNCIFGGDVLDSSSQLKGQGYLPLLTYGLPDGLYFAVIGIIDYNSGMVATISVEFTLFSGKIV